MFHPGKISLIARQDTVGVKGGRALLAVALGRQAVERRIGVLELSEHCVKRQLLPIEVTLWSHLGGMVFTALIAPVLPLSAVQIPYRNGQPHVNRHVIAGIIEVLAYIVGSQQQNGEQIIIPEYRDTKIVQ